MKPEMLAAAHWGYVESVLQLHGEQLDVIEKCGEHYKAAFVHGFKHGIESLSENSADKGSKIAVTRIYGARGADVFAEGMLSLHGDLIRIEGITLRIAKGVSYTPDFVVMLASGEIELHEVKGYWRDDARAKTRIAAEQFPFRIIAITRPSRKKGAGWVFEEI